MKLTIRKKILLCSLLPLLLLGLIIIALASTIVKQSIIDQVENSLKGTAIATQAAYDQNAGSYTYKLKTAISGRAATIFPSPRRWWIRSKKNPVWMLLSSTEQNVS